MQAFKELINSLTQPTLFTLISVIAFALYFWKYQAFKGKSWIIGAALALTIFLGIGMADPNAVLVITKPDNIPIVIMLYLTLFFTWLSM